MENILRGRSGWGGRRCMLFSKKNATFLSSKNAGMLAFHQDR